MTIALAACGGSVVANESGAPSGSSMPANDAGTTPPFSGTGNIGSASGSSSTSPPLGATCGARGTPSTCGPNRYCDFQMNRSGIGRCGRDDSGGTCAVKPTACPDNSAPVCGCDGATYSNDCDAKAKGVSVAHFAACGSFRCGMAWCDAETSYCDVPSPNSFNPEPSCQPLPSACHPGTNPPPTCGTCFRPLPCPMGSSCNPTCTTEQADTLPGFTLTHAD